MARVLPWSKLRVAISLDQLPWVHFCVKPTFAEETLSLTGRCDSQHCQCRDEAQACMIAEM